MFKPSILASFLFFLFSASTAFAEIYAGNVTGIGYDNGSFILEKDGTWSERRANYAHAFSFKQIQRADYLVNLIDESRGVRILLNMYDKTIYYADRNNPTERALYKMTWISNGRETVSLNGTPINTHPDLSKAWSSDFGPIHWAEGFYGNPDKTLNARLELENGNFVYRGQWGRKSNPSSKGWVAFTFSPDGKSFKGSYGAKDGSIKEWNGFAQ